MYLVILISYINIILLLNSNIHILTVCFKVITITFKKLPFFEVPSSFMSYIFTVVHYIVTDSVITAIYPASLK